MFIINLKGKLSSFKILSEFLSMFFKVQSQMTGYELKMEARCLFFNQITLTSFMHSSFTVLPNSNSEEKKFF